MGRKPAKDDLGPLARITPAWRDAVLAKIKAAYGTQKKFAEAIGISTSQLNQVLRDESKQSSHWVPRISAHLQLPLPEIPLDDELAVRAHAALERIRAHSEEAYKSQVRYLEELAGHLRSGRK